MNENEPLDKAAARELEEETSVKPSDVILEQASFLPQPQHHLFPKRSIRTQLEWFSLDKFLLVSGMLHLVMSIKEDTHIGVKTAVC